MEQTKEAVEAVLTYETLYEIVRKEKSRDELQKLDFAFIQQTLTYLRDKQQAYDDNLSKNDIFSQSERDKLHIQLTNVRRIIRDLYDVRERKLINMAINKSRTNMHIVDTAHLLPHERAQFDSMQSVLTQYRTGVLLRMLEMRDPDIMPVVLPLPDEKQSEPAVEETTKTIKFVEKVEQFVGKELELYGPFETNDETTLPSELADILISEGKAVES